LFTNATLFSTNSPLASHQRSLNGCCPAPYAVLFIDAVFKAFIDDRTLIADLFSLAIKVTGYRLIVWWKENSAANIYADSLFNPVAWWIEGYWSGHDSFVLVSVAH